MHKKCAYYVSRVSILSRYNEGVMLNEDVTVLVGIDTGVLVNRQLFNNRFQSQPAVTGIFLIDVNTYLSSQDTLHPSCPQSVCHKTSFSTLRVSGKSVILQTQAVRSPRLLGRSHLLKPKTTDKQTHTLPGRKLYNKSTFVPKDLADSSSASVFKIETDRDKK